EVPNERARLWFAVALAAGPVFGLAGATWLTGPSGLRPWAVAVLSGALAGEALYLALEYDVLGYFYLRDTATVLILGEFALAAALPFFMLRRAEDRLQALAGGAVCALVVCLAIAVVERGVQDALSPLSGPPGSEPAPPGAYQSCVDASAAPSARACSFAQPISG